MKRKSLATIIICFISAMLLAACGAANESTSADKPEAVEDMTIHASAKFGCIKDKDTKSSML